MRDDPKVIEREKPWPEHGAPDDVDISCSRFGLQGHGRLVWGEGNPFASIMLVLDNPGARETAQGVPFVCGTRQTLRQTLGEAGFDIDDLYVTFLVKCRPLRAYDKPLARRVGLGYLKEQIKRQKPRVIVGFGDVVSTSLFGKESAVVRVMRGAYHTFHDVPTVVTYHPLAARRRPSIFPLVVEDLRLAHGLGT